MISARVVLLPYEGKGYFDDVSRNPYSIFEFSFILIIFPFKDMSGRPYDVEFPLLPFVKELHLIRFGLRGGHQCERNALRGHVL